MGRFAGVDVGYDCLGEGQDEHSGTIAVCKGAAVVAEDYREGRQFGVLFHRGWEGRIGPIRLAWGIVVFTTDIREAIVHNVRRREIHSR